MAYFSLHAYDADVWLPEFKGLRQQDESLNTDIRFATEVLNVETPNGVLQPHAGYTAVGDTFANKVETIARFYRRWYDGVGSKYWMVCATGGKLFYHQEGSDVGWLEIPMPTGVASFASNVWSWCTYEINVDGVDHPIDVMLMSNPGDGMVMVEPPDKPKTWGDIDDLTWDAVDEMTWEEVLSAVWSIEQVETPKKFGVIERFAERIWGGAIPGDPDMLVYSAPYDPTDWEANPEIPEDGAGSIQQPTWDGDSFTALKAFGNQLIAFKEHRVWRVYGTDPGQFTFSEQYGGGAPFFNTIAVDVEKIYMADVNGLSVYDGMSVTPYARELIEPLWRKINRSAMDQMCAALYKNRYYLSVPMGNSPVNNAMIVLDMEEGTILYYEDLPVESMLGTPDAIYATSSSLPGTVAELLYDSWLQGRASGGATKWVSPWMDFGYKRINKGGFDMYIVPEVQDEPVTLTISVQTEKKTKTKDYTINPLTEAQLAKHKEHRGKRLHFGGNGRRFRIRIETPEGVTAPWRLIGGIQMVVETDPD